jgi:hypothetical protein
MLELVAVAAADGGSCIAMGACMASSTFAAFMRAAAAASCLACSNHTTPTNATTCKVPPAGALG